MNKLLVTILVTELVLAIIGGFGGFCLLRRDHVHAFAEWKNNPTPETKTELDRQEDITQRQSWILAGVAFVVIAGATVAVFAMTGNYRPKLQRPGNHSLNLT